MNLRKTLLVISLLLSISFVNAQGTIIYVEIDNFVTTGSYDITITLAQPSAQPSSGSLTYNITYGLDQMELHFDDTDICIKQIKAKYTGTCGTCVSEATLIVNCEEANYSREDIAPENVSTCYEFEYEFYDDIYNNCEELLYEFKID